jgi:glycosyltransferase involved in cell wall biosynthesis
VFVFPSLHTYFPVAKIPTVLGLHDAIADELPGLALGGIQARLLWRAKQTLALRQARSLFTVSESSRQVLSDRLGIAPTCFGLVPEAPDPAFHPRSEDQMATELGSMGVDGRRPLFVYAAGISPHKNVETLLDAHAILAGRLEVAPQLVVAGELSPSSYLSSAESIRARIADLGLNGSVLTPGFISDEALARLYSAATAAVVPSLAEGFGLPAVEAAACAAPVVLSDLPAHRENLGDGALYFPATDAGALAAQLERLVRDSDLRQVMSDRAQRAVGAMSWDVSARCLAGVIASATA